MKREELNKFLNKKVKVTLFDGGECAGILRSTNEPCMRKNINLCRNNFYFTQNYPCIEPHSFLFRASHVKKVKEVV